MRLYICVDDTDDLTKSTSTGKISDLIADRIAEMGGIPDRGVTRHQLLLHDDIAYTSHNSSMCMVMDIDGIDMKDIMKAAEEILFENMAESSDPGMCFCRLDQLREPDRLIAYGKRAQKEVLTKAEAYELAEQIGGTVLCEYGGDGSGVIGALAGAGLRLSGCDGTFRGGKDGSYAGMEQPVSYWKTVMGIEQVVDLAGNTLDDCVPVKVKEKLKLAMLDNMKTMVASEQDGVFTACTKRELYHGDRRVNEWSTPCREFQPDNDAEECYAEDEKACYNCLFRRWTAQGFMCVR